MLNSKDFYIYLLGKASKSYKHELIEKCLDQYSVLGTCELSIKELHDFCKLEGLI